MKIYECDKGKCGIYCIKNTVNDKVYIGKAKNIYNRMRSHKYNLRKKSKDENRHLINAGYKYGEDVFIYTILEEFDFDEQKLREREDYGIVEYDATNQDKGYNMRRDSSTGCLVSEETRQLLSEINSGENNPNYGNKGSDEQRQQMSKTLKEQYANGRTNSEKAGQNGITERNKRGEENPELKEEMKDKVSSKKTEYNYYQCDKKTGNVIKVGSSIHEILKEHPEGKRHNIYAACSGEKPSIYGYKGIKKLKDEIVQQ